MLRLDNGETQADIANALSMKPQQVSVTVKQIERVKKAIGDRASRSTNLNKTIRPERL